MFTDMTMRVCHNDSRGVKTITADYTHHDLTTNWIYYFKYDRLGKPYIVYSVCASDIGQG